MPTPTLYQCIQHSRIVSDVVLESSFQEALRKVCADLGVNLDNHEENSAQNAPKLEEPNKDDEFDFSDILVDKSPRRGRNMSREESLSAFLRFPDEQDSMGLDVSDYAQDFPGLDSGFDLYESTFDDPLDVTVRTKRLGEKDAQENKTRTEQDAFAGFVVDLSVKDKPKDENQSETFFEIDDKFFDLGDDGKDEEKEKEEQVALDIAKLLTPETQEKFDKYLIDVLLEKNAINKWQATQLCCGRSTFTLGNYRIVDLLGQGGYGRVFLARPPRVPSNVGKTGAKTKDDVAIKVLPFKNAKTLEPIGKFLREVEIAKRLEHPNLVRCFESSKDASVHYCVSEYVDGGDARQLLAEHVKTKGRLHYRIAAYIIAEAAKGLAYMHKEGVIHRDVKPGNILLMKTGEVKLADFGMVSVIKNFSTDSDFSSLGDIVETWEKNNASTYFKSQGAVQAMKLQIQGTPDYLAPDQLSPEGVKNPNPLWDIYSLGCSLYYMLTGLVPYPAEGSYETLRAQMLGSVPPEPIEYDQTIPRELSQLTMRMMEKNPNARAKHVGSANVVAAALERWIPREALKNYRLLGIGNNFWSDENLERFFIQGATTNAPFGVPRFSDRSSDSSGSSTRSRSSSKVSSSCSQFQADVRSNSPAALSSSRAANSSSSDNLRPKSTTTNLIAHTPPLVKRETYEDAEEIVRLERQNAKLIKYALLPLIGLTLCALVAAIVKALG